MLMYMQTDNADLVMTYNCRIWLQIDMCFEELRKLPSAQKLFCAR